MKPFNVLVFSPQPVNGSVAAPRLSKFLQELERRGVIKLKWLNWFAKGVPFSDIFMADMLVFQREFCQKEFAVESIIRDAHKFGKPVVYEIDDLLTNVTTGLVKRAQNFYRDITPGIKFMLNASDFVTTSTEALKKELDTLGAKGKTFVVPNFVDLSIWGGVPPPAPYIPNGPFVLGYVGTPSHNGDLDMIRPALVSLLNKYGPEKLIFRSWGCMPDSFKFIPSAKLVRGMVPDTAEHARQIREARIDLALAPLEKCAFNLSKSDIKFLEYGACYTPAVYSNYGPYQAIQHQVTGWRAENISEWIEAIETLMNNHSARQAIGFAAHDFVLKNRSFEAAVVQFQALYQYFYTEGRRKHGLGVPA